MFSSISRLQGKPTRILCFKSLPHCYFSSFTAVPTAALKPQNRFLVEYLTNSLGFSKEEEAISASNKADHLRLQTLQRMSCILTTRQTARGLLAFGEYFQRLRALSSLWAARPRERIM